MKHKTLDRFSPVVVLVAAWLSCGAFSAHASLIAGWTFDATTTIDNTVQATSGAQAGTALVSTYTGGYPSVGGTKVAPVFVTGEGGTGYALQLDPGQMLFFQVAGSGLSAFTITCSVYSTAVGSSTTWWGGYDASHVAQANPATVAAGNSFASHTVDYSNDPFVNNVSTALFLAENTSGSVIYYDNIQIQAVPEPVNAALGWAGLAVGAVWWVRRIRRTPVEYGQTAVLQKNLYARV